MLKPLISIKNCRIENSKKTLISDLSWEMFPGEAWLVIGPNGGGKADFINALAGNLSVVPNADYFNCFEIASSPIVGSSKNKILGLQTSERAISTR